MSFDAVKQFLGRLVEEAGVAFLGGVVGYFLLFAEGGGDFSTAVAWGGVLAGLRAAYGVLIKEFGRDPQRPSLK